MIKYTLTGEQLVKLAETPIPPETLKLLEGAPASVAAQIGWSNCCQMFLAELIKS